MSRRDNVGLAKARRQAMAHWCNRALASSFSAWRTSTAERAQLAHGLFRALQHWQSLAASATIRQWAAAAKCLAEEQAIMAGALRKLANR